MTSMPTNDAVRYPKLLVTSEAAKSLAEIALAYPHIETAGGVAGLIINQGESIIVTNIIPPSVMDIVRHVTTVKFGGDILADAAEWLMTDFELLHPADINNKKFEFFYLGKAHSHHGLGFNQFSSTDENSILESVQKFGLKTNVWPLLLIDENKSTIHTRGSIRVEVDTMVRILFYFLSAEMVAAGITKPILITPKVVDIKTLPKLPMLAWKWTDEQNFTRQLRQLKDYEVNVTPLCKNVDSDPEQEIQFLIQKAGWKGVLVINTDWNYPETPPVIKIYSGGKEHLVEKNLKGEPLWTPESDFINVVLELEEMEEL